MRLCPRPNPSCGHCRSTRVDARCIAPHYAFFPRLPRTTFTNGKGRWAKSLFLPSNPSRATTIHYPDNTLAAQTTCAEGFTSRELEPLGSCETRSGFLLRDSPLWGERTARPQATHYEILRLTRWGDGPPSSQRCDMNQ